jgi:hypothetical protein
MTCALRVTCQYLYGPVLLLMVTLSVQDVCSESQYVYVA